MKCPDCAHDLQPTDYRGVRIDECPNCRGRWFDRDELRIAKDRTDDDLRWLDFDPFGEEADRFARSSEGRRCPRDDAAMASLTYESSAIVIDKCAQCRGIWLNHGEFERIVQHLDTLVSAATASEYADEARKEFAEIFRGPEGLLSEVRDFLAVLHLLRLRMMVERPGIADAAVKLYQASPFK